MLVPNLISELKPTHGRSPLSGTAFTRDQFDPTTTQVFISIEGGAVTVRFDGVSGGTTPNHTLAQGTTGTWKLELLLAANFDGSGTVTVTELSR